MLKNCGGWLPPTCAYRLLKEGKDLYWWHYLVSGDRETVHQPELVAHRSHQTQTPFVAAGPVRAFEFPVIVHEERYLQEPDAMLAPSGEYVAV